MNERPELERLPDDEYSSDTDQNIPLPPSAAVPPPRRRNPPHTDTPQIRRVAVAPLAKRRKRRSGGLYIPIWSILAMLLIVFGIACGLVLLVLNLGGNTPEVATPVVIINSPVPTNSPDTFAASPATQTLPPDVGSSINDAPPQPPPSFQLFGPTLEAIATSTPTRLPLGPGVIVVVTDVEPDKLNVRDNPSTRETTVIFRADEGTRFTIIDGPQQSDGFTWWQIQNVTNANERGWAVSNYLEVDTNQ